MRMKANEVRAMTVEQLNDKLDSLKKDLFFLRMQHATNQLDNPLKIAETKRDIARVKTVIVLGQGAGLHHFHGIAYAAAVELVMGLQLIGAANDLLIERMSDAVGNSHDHGLIHLVGHDLTHTGLAGGCSLREGQVREVAENDSARVLSESCR